MPTPINGPVGQFGRGVKTCTRTGGALIANNMKLGPDGTNWELYSEGEIRR